MYECYPYMYVSMSMKRASDPLGLELTQICKIESQIPTDLTILTLEALCVASNLFHFKFYNIGNVSQLLPASASPVINKFSSLWILTSNFVMLK